MAKDSGLSEVQTGSDSYDPNTVRKFIATFITSRR